VGRGLWYGAWLSGLGQVCTPWALLSCLLEGCCKHRTEQVPQARCSAPPGEGTVPFAYDGPSLGAVCGSSPGLACAPWRVDPSSVTSWVTMGKSLKDEGNKGMDCNGNDIW
jgi:hypothetical protein